MMDQGYADFLASKTPRASRVGFEPEDMPSHLFDFQSLCVGDALRMGRAGLYLDTGLGKTRCQLEWSWQCINRGGAGNRALILTPLAVAKQMEREAQELGYDARVIRNQSEARAGINICNYDRMDQLSPDEFAAASLDESAILKNFSGKTSQALIAAFAGHRFRLSASATPAPNDHMELGQQAAFLGIMGANEMLMRWFINDTAEASQKWRLKKHAEQDFWDWMASWSRMAETPDDLGFDGSAYVLPPLNIHTHHVPGAGFEFGQDVAVRVNAANMFAVKRKTAASRADLAAEAMPAQDAFVAWCDTDAEADALKARMPDAVEVRGSMSIDRKEENLEAFATGQARVMITKPSIAGWGCNWQHCADMAFVGRSFSYELYYQAVRRCWRFGQKRPVNVHVVVDEGESHIGRVIDRKSDDHTRMKRAMASAMRRNAGRAPALTVKYNPTHQAGLPSWL